MLKKNLEKESPHLKLDVIEAPSSIEKETLYIVEDYKFYCHYQRAQGCVLPILTADNKNCDFSQCRYMIEDLENLDLQFCERVWCRHHKLPWLITQTKDYIVRETIASDVEYLWQIYNEPNIRKYVKALDTIEAEKNYIEQYYDLMYGYYELGIWSVLDKKTNKVIGRIGVELGEDNLYPELGFLIASPYQRKGVAFLVCKAIFEYIKENYSAKIVQVYVEKSNEPSLALCYKLGFQFIKEIERKGKLCYYLTLQL